MLFPTPVAPPPPNLTPLASIVSDWRAGGRSSLVNVVGDVIVFMPPDRMLPPARGQPTGARHVASIAGALSVAIEALQLAPARRAPDVDAGSSFQVWRKSPIAYE